MKEKSIDPASVRLGEPDWAPEADLVEQFLSDPRRTQAASLGVSDPHNPLADLLGGGPRAGRGGIDAPTSSPFQEFDRESWAALSADTPLPLTAADIERLRGLGDPLDLEEVDAIYRPLSALLQLYVAANTELCNRRRAFLREPDAPRPPFVIGVAGSVAVGKSSVSRLLKELLSRWPHTPKVELITTDGFLYPNAQLVERGIMHRKGFPESYDRRALLRFLAQVKSGAAEVSAPLYSHIIYDIVPDQAQVIRRPDILIVEGLNVLAPPRPAAHGANQLSVSDFFDFSLYLNARPTDIEEWYMSRFRKLRETAFQNPHSFFRTLAKLPQAEAEAHARSAWRDINLPNLIENVAPTRMRATLIINKDADHRVRRLQLRKI